MEAYNYFESGYVREVLSMAFGSGSSRYVDLKAKVKTSQHSPDNEHEPWIIARLDGHIVCAHCTCKPGNYSCISVFWKCFILVILPT